MFIFCWDSFFIKSVYNYLYIKQTNELFESRKSRVQQRFIRTGKLNEKENLIYMNPFSFYLNKKVIAHFYIINYICGHKTKQ